MHGSVLGRLDRGGSSSVSELAVAERVRPQSMAQTVGELEADGFVKRRPDPEDGRRALVELTDEGRAVLQADRRARDGWLAQAIEQDLSPREQDALAGAVEVLRRLAER
jgi:DNA-binding MarR family transcriptional regulator